MSGSGLAQFDATIQKTNEWIHDVMDELQWDNKEGSYHALREVLHGLRDRLTVAEAVDLGAQLPMLIRGFYYEGWKPSDVPIRVRTKDDFLNHIREGFRNDEWVDIERLTRAVFHVMTKHVTSGEIEDIRCCLPEELRELLE